MTNIIRISGNIKVKRNIVYVNRYVEVTDTSLTYYKAKGDNTPRFVFQLKDAQFEEDTKDECGAITLTTKDEQSVKEGKAYLKLKFTTEPEFKMWKTVLLECIKPTQAPESVSPGITSSINFRSSVRPPKVSEEEFKGEDSSLKKHKKNLSVGFVPPSNRIPENNQIPMTASNIMHAPILGESDLFVNNAGDSLPALKAQIFNFKKEGCDPMVLVDTKENHRVYLGPKSVVVVENRPAKEVNIWKEGVEKIREAFALDELFGKSYIYVVLAIIISLSFLTLNLLRELFSITSIIFILSISGFLLNRQYGWITPIYRKLMEKYGKKIPLPEVGEYLNKKLSIVNSEIVVTRAEYKVKATSVIKASISEILFVLNRPETRKFWQPYVADVEVQGKENIIRYIHDGNKFTETFSTTIYKEDNIIYVIEHKDLKVLRIVEIATYGLFSILTVYTKVSSFNLSNVTPNETPFFLSGLNSYIIEQRADYNSQLYKNYLAKFANNTWSMRETLLEGDHTLYQGSILERDIPQIEDEKSVGSSDTPAARNSLNEIPNRRLSFHKESILSVQEEVESPEKRLKKYQDFGVKIQDRVNNLFKAYQEPGWELLENNQEITIHIGQGSTSEIKIVCEAYVKADLARVLKILEDPTEWAKYDEPLESGGILEVLDENLRIEHLKYEQDSYFSAYDYISLKHKSQDIQGKTQLVFGSIEDNRVHSDEDHIRVIVNCGAWILSATKDGRTKVNYALWVDFKEAMQTTWVKKAARGQAMRLLSLKKYFV